MSILDRKFPFVISHTIWNRKPIKKRVRHFVGYVSGAIRLAVNVNRAVLDLIDEAFYDEEVIVEDKGLGHTRHFACDISIVSNAKGENVPVLKTVETSRPPACIHNYVVQRYEEPGGEVEPEGERHSYMPERLDVPSGPQEDLATMIDQVQIDLGGKDKVESRAGEIEGQDVFLNAKNGIS